MVCVCRGACFQEARAPALSSATFKGALSPLGTTPPIHAAARQASMAALRGARGTSQNEAGGGGCRASHPPSPSDPPPLAVAERVGVLVLRGLKKLCCVRCCLVSVCC